MKKRQAMAQRSRTTANSSEISHASLKSQIGLSLKSLPDRASLNRSPLTRHACVERVAKEQYAGRLMPRGLALRAILESCIDEVLEDLSGEPALKKQCEYLRMVRNGVTCTEIGRQLGLSREHVSRVYRRVAIELVTERFLVKTKNRSRAFDPPTGTS